MAILRGAFWVLHFLGLTVASFWLAWWLLTPVDFGYAWGYELLDIDAHIAEFAPDNMYRKGYETTSKAEHLAHFSAIVNAINAGGAGLAVISYQAPGQPKQTLLHEAEVVHLQDVSNLVALFHQAAPVLLLAWMVTFAWASFCHWHMPRAEQMLVGGGALLALCVAITLLVGPTRVFYWAHTRIFPEDHQWFFYYQESLMTTLMKAPDLFGFIATLWVTTSVALMVVMTFGARKAMQMHGMPRAHQALKHDESKNNVDGKNRENQKRKKSRRE